MTENHMLTWLSDAKCLIEEEDYEEAIELLLANLNSSKELVASVKCEGLKLLGTVYGELEEFDSAERVLEESLDSAKANDVSAREIVNILEILGEVYANDEKYTEAEAKLREAVTLFHDEEIDIINRISCLYMLGEVSSSLENDQEAKVHLEAAVRLARMVGDPEILSDCLRSLGDVYHFLDQFDEAEQALIESVDNSVQEGVPKEKLCRSLMIQGGFYHNFGMYGKARDCFERAVDVAQDNTVSPEATCYALTTFGESLFIHGMNEEAIQYLSDAVNLANTNDLLPQTYCTSLHSLGQGLHCLQRNEEAEKVLSTAVSLARNEQVGITTKCNCLCSYADVLYSQWDNVGTEAKLTQAENLLNEAIDLLRDEEGMEHSLCNALASLGEVLRNLNRLSASEEKLREALLIAESHALPAQPRCNASRSLGMLLADSNQIEEAIGSLEKSIDYMFQHFASHRGLTGVPSIVDTYQNLFEEGRRWCEQAWDESKCSDEALLCRLLAFWDSEKCISIRERLHRQLSRPNDADHICLHAKWRGGSSNWRKSFTQQNGEGVDPQLANVRMLRNLSDSTKDRIDALLELPNQNDSFKDNFCHPITLDEVNQLLLTDNSVIIGFYFDDDDLIFLPIRRDPQSKVPRIIHCGENLFRVKRVRSRLRELLHVQQQMILALKKYKLVGSSAAKIDKEIGSWQKTLSEPLYSLFQWEDLFELITFKDENVNQLHLTFILHDFLYQLPIHAAFNAGTGQRLFEMVGSIHYGLSLRTLELQTRIQQSDQRRHRQMKGTVFVFSNPDREYGNDFLAHAFREVEGLVAEVGFEHLWIHGDQGSEISTRDHLRSRHALGNLLWHITHGGEKLDKFEVLGQGECRVFRPSILLTDGIVSDSRMVAEHYDFSTLLLNHYSCCTLGKTTSVESTQELEGWIASLTQLGCRRVSCAIWPLCDAAAADFGRCWIKALKEQAFIESPEPHAFSHAFKESLSTFRSSSSGRWNHEFYWAPYVLYGLA